MINFTTFKAQLVSEFSRKFPHLTLAYEYRKISEVHCFYVKEMGEDVLDFAADYSSLYMENIQEDDIIIVDSYSLLEPIDPEILWFGDTGYCQREIEGEEVCDHECSHCRKYYSNAT